MSCTRENNIKLAFTGDFCPVGAAGDAVVNRRREELVGPVDALFDKADLVVGNLETPLVSGGKAISKTGANFRSDPALADHIKSLGFDVLTLANNHIADYGKAGILDTMRALESASILHCGAGLTHEDASTPVYVSVKGRTLAILSFADGEFAEPTANGPGAARLDLFANQRQIETAQKNADVVVVCVHSGNEYQVIPSPRVRQNFHRLAEAGADAVIGHHPHIPLTYEIHEGVPVCYSLGNFLFQARGKRPPAWYLAEIPVLTLGGSSPTVNMNAFHVTSDSCVKELSDAQKAAFKEYLVKAADVLKTEQEHIRVWEEEVRRLFSKKWPRWRSRLASLVLPEEKTITRWMGSAFALVHRSNATGPALLYNLTGCLAHRLVLRTATRLMLEGRYENRDEEAEEKLSEIESVLNAACSA